MPLTAKIHEKNIPDLISMSIIGVLTVFVLIHSWAGPQFIDGYYHLSCANAFIKSGGWVGTDWWSISPQVRPQLYPPLYHLVLVFLLKCGLFGADALRLSEGLCGILFFPLIWAVLRYVVSKNFALIFLLLSAGFFPFFASVTANVPASLGLILAFLSFYFFARNKIISSAIFLTLCFYTHTGIALIFILGFLFAAVFSRERRRDILRLLVFCLLPVLPFLVHQIKGLPQVKFALLHQDSGVQISIFLAICCAWGMFRVWKEKNFLGIFFLGLLIAEAAVFFKYPYRLFSAQGVVGAALVASLAVAGFLERAPVRYRSVLLGLIVLIGLFFQPAAGLSGSRFKLDPSAATLTELGTGRWHENIEFCDIYYPQLFAPAIAAIKKTTGPRDIIDSNVSVVAQMLSALTGRLSARSIYREVRQKQANPEDAARVIVWVRSPDGRGLNPAFRHDMKLIYENSMYAVFENPACRVKVDPLRSKIPFPVIIFLLAAAAAAVIWENLRSRKI